MTRIIDVKRFYKTFCFCGINSCIAYYVSIYVYYRHYPNETRYS